MRPHPQAIYRINNHGCRKAAPALCIPHDVRCLALFTDVAARDEPAYCIAITCEDLTMAYEGELVRTQSGRWARFQRCAVVPPNHGVSTILVAIELPAEQQKLLDSMVSAIEACGQGVGGVQLRLEADAEGRAAVRVEPISPVLA